jgi:hypothetical protein
MTVALYGTDLAIAGAVRLDPSQPVTLDAEGVSWNGLRLERLEALFVHGFRYEDPVLPPADPACDWSLWQAGTVIRQQSWSFLYSIWAHLERITGQNGGPRLYNPVSTELAAFDRLGLLDRLDRAGFAVPPLLLANDEGTVAAFQQRHAPAGVVWRPATGRAAWQLFRDKQCRALVGVERPPVLLAAVEPGRLLRVYVLDGEAVLTLATAAPNREGLERLEAMAAVAGLPDGFRETVGRAVLGLGLRWACALVVEKGTEGGTGPVFYDIDPDPELSDLPAPFEAFLKSALVAALTGAPPPAATFGPEPVERPALLLRRMLAIQFDMEQTKAGD